MGKELDEAGKRVIKKTGTPWRNCCFHQWDQRYWTGARIPGLCHWIRSFLFHRPHLRNYLVIDTVAECFLCIFHLILPTPWDGYDFSPHFTNKKTGTRGGQYFVQGHRAWVQTQGVTAKPTLSATTNSTPCCCWWPTGTGQAAYLPAAEGIKWDSASNASINLFCLIIQSQGTSFISFIKAGPR